MTPRTAIPRWERCLVWFLRTSASFLGMALVAVALPLPIMARLHALAGLGEMPETAIVSYLARSGSAMYVMLGFLYWRVARNVPKYLELIRFLALVKLAFGIGVLALDRAIGMPTWWTLTEGPFVIVWSLTLLALVRKAAEERAEAGHGVV